MLLSIEPPLNTYLEPETILLAFTWMQTTCPYHQIIIYNPRPSLVTWMQTTCPYHQIIINNPRPSLVTWMQTTCPYHQIIIYNTHPAPL